MHAFFSDHSITGMTNFKYIIYITFFINIYGWCEK